MKNEQTADCVENFVRSVADVTADDPLFTREVDLIEMGYLDSVGVVALLTYIENELQAVVGDDSWIELAPLSINAITTLINNRTAPTHADREAVRRSR
jgi:acyl carrier protein